MDVEAAFKNGGLCFANGVLSGAKQEKKMTIERKRAEGVELLRRKEILLDFAEASLLLALEAESTKQAEAKSAADAKEEGIAADDATSSSTGGEGGYDVYLTAPAENSGANLLNAAMSGDWPLVRLLISSGADVNFSLVVGDSSAGGGSANTSGVVGAPVSDFQFGQPTGVSIGFGTPAPGGGFQKTFGGFGSSFVSAKGYGGFGAPAPGGFAFGSPALSAPIFGAPIFGAPIFGAPAYSGSSFSGSSFVAPAPGGFAFGASAYGGSSFGTPAPAPILPPTISIPAPALGGGGQKIICALTEAINAQESEIVDLLLDAGAIVSPEMLASAVAFGTSHIVSYFVKLR